MSKEYLEAFKNLKQELYYSPNQLPDIDKWHETIEQALQRLEAIDNANPSKALECLDNLGNSLSLASELLRVTDTSAMDKYITTIKRALLKAQEQEKALKIIKNNLVDLYALFIAYDLEDYNIKHTLELTQEEFSLLKEVLGNE